MKDVNKALFAALLIPAYLTVIIVLLGATIGSIRWGYTAVVLLLFVIGAWFSSYGSKIHLNIIGFIAYLLSSGYIIVSSMLKTSNQKSGFEYIEIAMGVIVVLFGLIPLLYHILKKRSATKRT